jgi:hypothetical protein
VAEPGSLDAVLSAIGAAWSLGLQPEEIRVGLLSFERPVEPRETEQNKVENF